MTAPKARPKPARPKVTAPRVIKVDALARVEGEGALYVRVKDGVVQDVKFKIFEPPRFFEAFLQGRFHAEAPDITARICGICPIAYIMGASHAMEAALGIRTTEVIERLRRILYCGEWIQSHVLHAAMLHAPDFLELDDALQLAKANPEAVTDALRLKKLGNTLMEVIGGRSVHPVNTRVGGFYKAPKAAALTGLLPELRWGLEASDRLARLFATFDFPRFEDDYLCLSLQHPDVYAIDRGRLVDSRGLDIPIEEFLEHFDEEHVAHSNALHGVRKGDDVPYLVGPIARFNNNFEQLSDDAKALARACGLDGPVRNPFKSILVRMVETFYAIEEAIRLIEGYQPPDPSHIEVPVHEGEGTGCTEAPRGICWHRYSLDKDGRILNARIVPPTAQNQPRIERDLWGVVETHIQLEDEALKWRCEQAIRNYDPCISCATHFLDLTIERE